MHLFVAGLPYDLDDAELLEFFEKFGEVISAKVAIDKETGKSRGFGFVEMVNDEDGKEAIEGLNELQLGKKVLVVKQADERASAPRGGGGNFRGGSGGNRGGGGYQGNNYRGNSGFRGGNGPSRGGNNNGGGYGGDRNNNGGGYGGDRNRNNRF